MDWEAGEHFPAATMGHRDIQQRALHSAFGFEEPMGYRGLKKTFKYHYMIVVSITWYYLF